MTRFDRYVLAQLLSLFGFFALVLVGVYWINRAVSLFDQIIADGQSAAVFVELTALTLPNVIRIVLPIPAFVAAIYAANRLLSESELVVAQAAGLGPFRLMRPVWVFGGIVVAILWVLSNALVPAARAELSRRQDEIAQNVAARFLVEGRFQHPAAGLTLYVREIRDTGEMRGLFLSDNRRPEARISYSAEKALLVVSEHGPRLVMLDGIAQTITRDGQRLGVLRFAEFTYDLAELLAGRQLGRPSAEELPTPVVLAADAATQEATGQTRAHLLHEGHARIAQPLMGLAAPLLGFAAVLAGGFSRYGLWRPVTAAVAGVIVLQVLSSSATGAALADARLVWVVYLPPLAGIAAALLVLLRTRRLPRPGWRRAVP